MNLHTSTSVQPADPRSAGRTPLHAHPTCDVIRRAGTRQVCLGILGWGPNDFWAADTWSVMDAYEGYCIGKGIKDKEPEKPAADDVRRWKAMIEEAGREDA